MVVIDYCLGLGTFKGRKMLDLQKKYAIDSFKWHVSIQASNLAFLQAQFIQGL
jgi:hypothetical protein